MLVRFSVDDANGLAVRLTSRRLDVEFLIRSLLDDAKGLAVVRLASRRLDVEFLVRFLLNDANGLAEDKVKSVVIEFFVGKVDGPAGGEV